MYRPTSEELSLLKHGTMIVDRSLRVHQVIGLPAPSPFIVTLTKYRLCGRDTPWRLGRLPLCRLLTKYSAREAKEAAAQGGVRLVDDPFYNSKIPLLDPSTEIIIMAEPEEALRAIIARPQGWLERLLIHIITSLSRKGVGGLGVTGSLALGFHSDEVSDIDLIVYESENAERAIKAFREVNGIPARAPLSTAGGVRLSPPTDLAWRRLLIRVPGENPVHVSWTGAPLIPGSHCPPLREWRSLPSIQGVAHIEVSVEPGQPSALLYPPCVETRDGDYIISFEYNVAMHLFTGGRMRVSGLRAGGEALVLAAEEYPGSLSLLGGGEYASSFR